MIAMASNMSKLIINFTETKNTVTGEIDQFVFIRPWLH